jgi:two-component sensor histidine kinase
VRDGEGALLYAVRLFEDITGRKQSEARQHLLIDELNHRVKNTLATVQSLAAQTFRQGHPPEIAQARFEARLMALSRTHNLLNETRWMDAPLSRVLSLELAPYQIEGNDRVVLSGPEVDLDARSAVVLGMVVHELATNAAKVGALSNAEGRVAVTWSATSVEDGTKVEIRWCERGGPAVVAPTRRGFGSRLIEHAVRGELAEGLTCTISFTVEDARSSSVTLRDAAE